MNKKELILWYIEKLFLEKEKFYKEEHLFTSGKIELLYTINSLKSIANYNDLINSEICLDFYPIPLDIKKLRYIKELIRLKDENNLKDIKEILDYLYKDLVKFLYNNKVEDICSLLSDHIEWIDLDYVIKYINENNEKDANEIIDFITEDQKIKNITPNISKKDFFEKFPNILELIDKDLLLDITDLEIDYNKEWIFVEDYFIYYDDLFFDLGITNPFIFDFFWLYKNYSDECKFKIKLNFDMIVSKENYKELILLWGLFFWPEFSIDKFFTNSDKVLFTRKKRLNEKFDRYFWNKIYYTDFNIDQRDNSFLIEEIWENKYKDYYYNRLIHSKFNIENNVIEHFDGSILFYDIENLNKRKEKLLSNYPKLSCKKSKLFRIDWKLDFDWYRNLLISFYNDNEMILEYFNLDEYKEKYSHILDYENQIDY